jgi:hypothetical protein
MRPSGRSLAQAGVGGLVAGGVFIGFTMWFATTDERPPLAPLKLIATLVLDGPAQDLSNGTAWVGIGIHALLSVAFGLVFGLVAPWLRRYDSVVAGGLVYGSLIYLVNFQILARIAFPQFLNTNAAVEASLHMLFGAVLAATVLPGVLAVDVGPPGTPASVRWVAAVASSGVLLVHFGTAGHHFEQEIYVGFLFVLGSALLTAVAILLTRRDDPAVWSLGALIHAGMLVALPVSRTVGLPFYAPPNWPMLGTESLVLEAVYLVTFAVAMVRWRQRRTIR